MRAALSLLLIFVSLTAEAAAPEAATPDMFTRLQAIITTPDVTFLLMTLGTYGLIAEFAHPGALFPGILGGICLMLGLYALNILPVNYAGLALVLLGLGCMTAEAFTAGIGVLGIGGVAAFALGAIFLFDPASGLSVSPWIIAGTSAVSFGLLSFLLAFALKDRNRPVSTGAEALIGAMGEVVEWHQTEGTALVAGTIWKTKSSAAYILKKGDKVSVTAIDGLTLIIEPHTS